MEKLMTLLRSKETGEYIEILLTYMAAPTIQGLKAGSLVNLRRQGDRNIIAVWNERKEKLSQKLGVDVFTLPNIGPRNSGAALVFLYKKDLLSEALRSMDAWSILSPLGYDVNHSGVDSLLKRLGERFAQGFPHEVGIFLGYPPEDVRGFIQNRGAGFLSAGYWKVYGDVPSAKRAFRSFRRAELDAARAIIG